MPRFRPERIGWAMALALLCIPACRSVGAGRESWNHPAVLVGAWVDVAKATPGDTSLWLLGPNGEDWSQHLRAVVDADSVTPRFLASTPKQYRYWYLEGAMADSAERRMCFLNLTGRSTGHCLTFSLDSVPTPQGPRRRLHVRGYRGSHSVTNRVLVARDP